MHWNTTKYMTDVCRLQAHTSMQAAICLFPESVTNCGKEMSIDGSVWLTDHCAGYVKLLTIYQSIPESRMNSAFLMDRYMHNHQA